MTGTTASSLVDAICELADEIARLCPDCADRAKRLVALVGDLRSAPLDRTAIEDAITSETAGSDVSDAQVRTTAEAVLRAARTDEGA